MARFRTIVIGRVHTGQIQIENDYIASTFSIMEDQPMDLIIGLGKRLPKNLHFWLEI